MDIFARMVSTQTVLFLMILLGVIVRKAGIITPQTRGSYNLFLLNVTLPAMILNSFLGETDAGRIAQAGTIIAVSAGFSLSAYAAGVLLWRRRPQPQRSVLAFATTFTNSGNAGLPVVQMVFGDTGTFLASVFMIPARVMMWTVGIALFIPAAGSANRIRKLLLNPSVLVVFLGIPMMLLGLRLPDSLAVAVRRVGDITGPLSMVLIGTTLAELPIREAFCRDAWLLTGLRLVALPLLFLSLLRLLGAEPMVIAVAVTLSAMPVASNTVVLSERYGADYHLAGKCVFVSTLLSLFTVPLLTLLL